MYLGKVSDVECPGGTDLRQRCVDQSSDFLKLTSLQTGLVWVFASFWIDSITGGGCWPWKWFVFSHPYLGLQILWVFVFFWRLLAASDPFRGESEISSCVSALNWMLRSRSDGFFLHQTDLTRNLPARSSALHTGNWDKSKQISAGHCWGNVQQSDVFLRKLTSGTWETSRGFMR